MNLFNDPAWSIAALAAAVFGGLLTNVIWKFGRWFISSFLPSVREAKRAVDQARQEFANEMAKEPMLIVLNTLYLFLILLLALGLSAILWLLPLIAVSVDESAAPLRGFGCNLPLLEYVMCSKPSPVRDVEIALRQGLLMMRPFIFFAMVFFFTWFWSRISLLLMAFRVALGKHTLGPSSSIRF